MAINQKQGYLRYVPYFLIDEKGIIISNYFMSDVIMECARAGVKAGNYLLEDLEESRGSRRKNGLIDALKKI